MSISDCVSFLQWSLPELHYRWPGFRKVRGQVCKRILRRIKQLKLSDYEGYRNYLASHKGEWDILDSFCRITISRFYRDKNLWEQLQRNILPSLSLQAIKNGEKELNCWSIGCCSGEEPYTLNIIWNLAVKLEFKSNISLKILATDSDQHLLERAQKGLYSAGSMKEFPKELIPLAFTHINNYGEIVSKSQELERKSQKLNRGENANGITSHKGDYDIRNEFRENIIFKAQDIRGEIPEEKFHLIFCRYLVFTYFDEELQWEIVRKIGDQLLPNGYLIIGKHESLPKGGSGFIQYDNSSCIFKKE
jgi:chemotaxis protein methyltransferase CheR